MKVLFLHGWQSVPGGVKPTYLQRHGLEVINPALDDDNFEAAVKTARDNFREHRPSVVIGSSRGGAVAMNIDIGESGLVLLCPAWRRWGTAERVKPDAIILHSRRDEVIPFEDSESLTERSQATLIEVGSDHRLADPDSLSVMLWACQVLGSGQRLPGLQDSVQLGPSKKARKKWSAEVEATYLCDACGEEIVVPLDYSEGGEQEYVEDCPVCCHANVLHVTFGPDGRWTVNAEPEKN